MQKLIRNFINGMVLASLVTLAMPLLPAEILPRDAETKTAQAVENAPVITVGVGDLGCTAQFGSATVYYPGGVARATDTNRKDIDCAQVQLGGVTAGSNWQSTFNMDFQLGISVSESENGCTSQEHHIAWTGWASEGTASGLELPSGQGYGSTNAADCVNVYMSLRAMPAGRAIKDVKIGLRVGGGNRVSTPWATEGGGPSGYSTGNDFTTAEIFLESKAVAVTDEANYISTTIPQHPTSGYPTGNPAGSSMGTLSLNATRNYNVVMKNMGGTWESDREISRTIVSANPQPSGADCQSWVPTATDQTCVEERVVASNNFKLRRLDNNSSVQTPSGDIEYRRVLRYIYRSYEIYDQLCVAQPHDSGPLDPNGTNPQGTIINYNDGFDGWVKKTRSLFIKTAKATHEQTCDAFPSGQFSYSLVSIEPTRDVSYEQTVAFPFDIKGIAVGVYELRFQMVKNDTAFGGVASITVNVGETSPLDCTISQTVTTPQIAYYQINASGANSDVSITMSSSPSGPVMSSSPLILASPGYSAVAQVPTSILAAGSYSLVFKGTIAGQNAQCDAKLNVLSPAPVVDLRFNGDAGPVVLPATTTSGIISWQTQYSTSCTASTSPQSNSVNPVWEGPVTSISSGSSNITGLKSPTAYTFTLLCSGPGGTTSDSVSVSYSQSPQNPSADLKCLQDSTYQDACTGDVGSYAYLKWYNNAFTLGCTLSDDNSDLKDIGKVEPNYNLNPIVVGPINTKTTFTLTCNGAAGSTPAVDNLVYSVDTGYPDYKLSISPISSTVTKGASAKTYIKVTPSNGFSYTLNISVASFCNSKSEPCGYNGNVALKDELQQIPYDTETEATITTGSLDAGDYTITFKATHSIRGRATTKTISYKLVVNDDGGGGGSGPDSVSVDNQAQCGAIDVSWKLSDEDPTITGFKVYRQIMDGFSGSGWTEVTQIGKDVRTYRDKGSLASSSSYKYAVSAMRGTNESSKTESQPQQVMPVECAPSLAGSDKDLVDVQRNGGQFYTDFQGDPCSNSGSDATIGEVPALRAGELYRVGDKLTFRICVKNSGTEALKNLTITELVNDPKTYIGNLEGITFVETEGGSSCTGKAVGPVWSFDYLDVGESCLVTVTAVIRKPDGSAGLYRFSNAARIDAFGAESNLPIDKIVQISNQMFSVGAENPIRNETAP